MLSICIPIYNFDVTELVKSLDDEIKTQKLQVEIILIDDASHESFREINKALNVQNYVQLEQNIGRSAIRNKFLEFVHFDWLLFLDCDSKVEGKHFLSKYLNTIQNNSASVFCGGRHYPKHCPSKSQKLSWNYGKKRESKSALARSKSPNKSFMTNNFLIRKAVLAQIQFDERIKNYGHEDTLFGIMLEEKAIAIEHIENSILNGHIETNEVFLKKTHQALENLKLIFAYYENKGKLTEHISLMAFTQRSKLRRSLLKMVFKIFGKTIKALLTSGQGNVFLFDTYRLGYFCSLK